MRASLPRASTAHAACTPSVKITVPLTAAPGFVTLSTSTAIDEPQGTPVVELSVAGASD